MKFIERFCLAFFVVCALVEVQWGIVHGIALLGWKEMGAEAWAAWVQAIGSIGAICGAIWISREDARRTEKKNLDEQHSLAKGVLIVANRAKYLLRRIESGEFAQEIGRVSAQKDWRNTYIAFVKREAEEIQSILEEIQIGQLAGAGLIDAVLSTRLAMRDLIQSAPYFEFDDLIPKDMAMAQLLKIKGAVVGAIQALAA